MSSADGWGLVEKFHLWCWGLCSWLVEQKQVYYFRSRRSRFLLCACKVLLRSWSLSSTRQGLLMSHAKHSITFSRYESYYQSFCLFFQGRLSIFELCIRTFEPTLSCRIQLLSLMHYPFQFQSGFRFNYSENFCSEEEVMLSLPLQTCLWKSLCKGCEYIEQNRNNCIHYQPGTISTS